MSSFDLGSLMNRKAGGKGVKRPASLAMKSDAMGFHSSPPNSEHVWGSLCQKKLRATSWKLFDLFGGCLCTRKAWEAIAAAAAEMWGVKCALSFDFVVEWHRSCQSFIKTMYPEACIFGDIMDLVQDTSVPVGSMKLVRTAWCAQHEQECPVPTGLDCGLMGPPCITFSKYGKGEKWSNKLLRAIHDCGTCFQRKCPISIHENVPQYEESYLDENLGSHGREHVVLDPTLFGHPNSRERTFRICYQKSKKKWACDMTLQQIADHMLVPKKTPLPLDFHVYILKQDHEHAHEEVDLTRSESNHLVKYRKVCPTNELFDLSANVEKRKRVELKNRTFPCLTTSSNFWSEKFLRKL